MQRNKSEIDYQNELRRKALLKRQKEREEAVSMIQVPDIVSLGELARRSTAEAWNNRTEEDWPEGEFKQREENDCKEVVRVGETEVAGVGETKRAIEPDRGLPWPT